MTEPDRSGVSRAWSWRHAIAKSGLQPVTRLVLHTLGLKMDATGGSCYPPISELVELTGLDKKTVIKHLDIAEQAGWITVSEHGFRGQRWKRNEYVARWPGRDLDGHASVENCEGGGAVPPAFGEQISPEGGGALPPPSGAKVGEMVPEGGGNGSIKVVEQLPQDKILPTNSPENLPFRESAGEGKAVRKIDRDKVKKAYIAWFDRWPKTRQGKSGYAENTWFSLSDDERAECIRLTPAYLRLNKVDDLPTAPTYLKERGWTSVHEQDTAPEKTRGVAKPFGKLWMGLWIDTVSRPADATRIKITAFDERQVELGHVDRDELLYRKRLEHGWPVVSEMREKARRGEAFVTSLGLLPAVSGFRQLRSDSHAFKAWQDWHRQRGLPFPERAPEWVWLPAMDEVADDLLGAVDAAVSGFLSSINKGRSDDAA